MYSEQVQTFSLATMFLDVSNWIFECRRLLKICSHVSEISPSVDEGLFKTSAMMQRSEVRTQTLTLFREEAELFWTSVMKKIDVGGMLI